MTNIYKEERHHEVKYYLRRKHNTKDIPQGIRTAKKQRDLLNPMYQTILDEKKLSFVKYNQKILKRLIRSSKLILHNLLINERHPDVCILVVISLNVMHISIYLQ